MIELKVEPNAPPK